MTIRPKSKKELTEDQIYPLYIVDSDTLGYVEVPEKFWKIIGNPDAAIPEESFSEYLTVITKYGLNSVVVPKFELEKYIKRLAKKKQEPVIEVETEDAE